MMNFIYQIARLFVGVRNRFSSKHYQVQLLGRAILFSRRNPEIVIRDYYFYIHELLCANLNDVSKNCFVFYDCNAFKFFKVLLSVVDITLQIEHTLCKVGSPTSVDGFPGGLKTLDGRSTYLIRIANLKKIVSADIIFDYSRINLYNIRSSPQLNYIFNKSFCISPSLYDIDTSVIGRSGVITLFGNPNISRRKFFLDLLQLHNVQSKNIRDVYFGVDEIYRKAKIVINIRQTEGHDTLEELRILPALRSGAIVICEESPYAIKTWYSKYIIWGSLMEMPKLILDTEKNYHKIHVSIFGESVEISPFFRRMKRIERCNLLAMQRAIKKINRDVIRH
jgi:hypothetical protein